MTFKINSNDHFLVWLRMQRVDDAVGGLTRWGLCPDLSSGTSWNSWNPNKTCWRHSRLKQERKDEKRDEPHCTSKWQRDWHGGTLEPAAPTPATRPPHDAVSCYTNSFAYADIANDTATVIGAQSSCQSAAHESSTPRCSASCCPASSATVAHGPLAQRQPDFYDQQCRDISGVAFVDSNDHSANSASNASRPPTTASTVAGSTASTTPDANFASSNGTCVTFRRSPTSAFSSWARPNAYVPPDEGRQCACWNYHDDAETAAYLNHVTAGSELCNVSFSTFTRTIADTGYKFNDFSVETSAGCSAAATSTSSNAATPSATDSFKCSASSCSSTRVFVKQLYNIATKHVASPAISADSQRSWWVSLFFTSMDQSHCGIKHNYWLNLLSFVGYFLDFTMEKHLIRTKRSYRIEGVML